MKCQILFTKNKTTTPTPPPKKQQKTKKKNKKKKQNKKNKTKKQTNKKKKKQQQENKTKKKKKKQQQKTNKKKKTTTNKQKNKQTKKKEIYFRMSSVKCFPRVLSIKTKRVEHTRRDGIWYRSTTCIKDLQYGVRRITWKDVGDFSREGFCPGCKIHRRYFVQLVKKSRHYENTPIQIYWKFHHQKLKIFR